MRPRIAEYLNIGDDDLEAPISILAYRIPLPIKRRIGGVRLSVQPAIQPEGSGPLILGHNTYRANQCNI
jgi:hypothetical protein